MGIKYIHRMDGKVKNPQINLLHLPIYYVYVPDNEIHKHIMATCQLPVPTSATETNISPKKPKQIKPQETATNKINCVMKISQFFIVIATVCQTTISCLVLSFNVF